MTEFDCISILPPDFTLVFLQHFESFYILYILLYVQLSFSSDTNIFQISLIKKKENKFKFLSYKTLITAKITGKILFSNKLDHLLIQINGNVIRTGKREKSALAVPGKILKHYGSPCKLLLQ